MAAYYVKSFGCRANQADGDAIAAELSKRGLDESPDSTDADVIVVNTCTVTANADRTARAFIRRVHRLNPNARIVVTGCYAQRDPHGIAELPGVSAVVGNSHKGMVPQIALTRKLVPAAAPIGQTTPASQSAGIYADDSFAHSSLAMMAPRPSASEAMAGSVDPNSVRNRPRTRPNLKVQDGCGNRCSFCIIPKTRGESRSVPLQESLRAVDSFVEQGGKELVLSGINLGRWGRDLVPGQRFEDLVETILTRTKLPRLRLSSIEPMDWSPRLLSLYGEYASGPAPRLARHAHLPLQSGSDAVLRAMHRRYRPWHYAEKLDSIRLQMPDAAIGADVMVGFPGESRGLFEESFAFIRERPFTYLHLFPFSARPGTPGWSLQAKDPVPGAEIHERMTRLQQWIGKANLDFRQRFLDRELPAITLETSPGEADLGRTRALTDNFLEIHLEASLPPNLLVEARVTSVTSEGLKGEVPASND